MKVKVFQINSNGKIEFTRAELEKLLNEVYDGGFRDGEKSTWTWTSPYIYNSDLGTTTTSDTSMPLTINSSTTQPTDNLTCNTTPSATFTVSSVDKETAAKRVNEVLETFKHLKNQPNDVFINLAKELNF
jgi:hypothetical protein